MDIPTHGQFFWTNDDEPTDCFIEHESMSPVIVSLNMNPIVEAMIMANDSDCDEIC